VNDSQDPSRRRFHEVAIAGLTTAIGATVAIPAGFYLLVPPGSGDKGEWTEVADLAELGKSGPEEVVFRRRRKDGWKVVNEKTSAWVHRVSDKEVVAFAPTCTHLGCAFHWEAATKTYICPCHTSAFSPSGEVLDGPASRPLDRYEVKVEDGKLLLGRVLRSEEQG
jgi:menaquinol-cytochrome c reductase iron-sulfur subunit